MLSEWKAIGRLTRDPEERQTGKGAAIASFTVAVDADYTDPDGNRDTDYYDCVAFRGLAEVINKNLKKGRLVCVSGRPKERKWEAEKDGVKYPQKKTEYILDNVYFLDSKGNKQELGSDDDIPF